MSSPSAPRRNHVGFMSVDWRSAAGLLGLKAVGAGLGCPACGSELQITADTGSPGREHLLWWLSCPACGLADDIFGIAAEVWKANREDAIRRMGDAGYLFPQSEIGRYLARRAGPIAAMRRLLRAVETDGGSTVLSVPSDWLTRTLPSMSLSGSSASLKKRLSGGTSIPAMPIYDAPGRPTGLALLRDDELTHVLRLPDIPSDDVGVISHDGFPRRVGGTTFLVEGVRDYRMMADVSQRMAVPAPVIGWDKSFTGAAAWAAAAVGDILVCGRTVTSHMVAGMARVNGRHCRMDMRQPVWLERLAEPADLLMAGIGEIAVSWQSVLERWMDRGPEIARKALAALARAGLGADRLRPHMTQKLAALVAAAASPSAESPEADLLSRLDERTNVVQVGDALFVRSRTGNEHQIANLVVRVRRVIRLTGSRTTWLDGEILFEGRRLDFLVQEDRVGVRWLRETLMDAGLGVPVVSPRWAGRLVEVSERLHAPELSRVRDDVGWDHGSRSLILPGWTIEMGGAIHENKLPTFPGLPFTGGLGVRRPEPLTVADISPLGKRRTGGPGVALVASVAGALLGPAVGRRPAPTWVYGDLADTVMTNVAKSLGCPVLRPESARDLGMLSSFEETKWPSILVCRDPGLLETDEVRAWLMPGKANRFAVVDRLTAMAAAAAGSANVLRVDHGHDMASLVSLTSRLLPAYLHSWCSRYGRPHTPFSSDRSRPSLIREICADVFDMACEVWAGDGGSRPRGGRRTRVASPDGFWMVNDNGPCEEAAEAALRLMVLWAAAGRLRLVACGFEKPSELARVASYDLDRDILRIPTGLLDSLLSERPTPLDVGGLKSALDAAGVLRPDSGGDNHLAIPYSVWRDAAMGHKKAEKALDNLVATVGAE